MCFTMHKLTTLAIFCFIGLSTALSANSILRKFDNLRYQHAIDSNGNYHLVDLWATLSDLTESARYNPQTGNIYHLFTRSNPTLSQPLLPNNLGLLQLTNFASNKRTIILIHGWLNTATSDFNAVLVPAFLAAEDVNVIVVDWSAGAGAINFNTAIINAIASGKAVAEFINWINEVTPARPVQYHIVGHGLGAHQAGIVGRNVNGDITYITGLDPSFVGWINHTERFHPADGYYTEVIHTNCGVNGYIADLAQVDFYPNGGESMPGCDTHACDHARSFYYFAESIISRGFTGRQCLNYVSALLQSCSILPTTLQMGGLRPKIGSLGVYLVKTNAAPPFSMG